MRAQRRGAIAVAVTAMRRAAELSEPGHRSRRCSPQPDSRYEAGDRMSSALLHEVDGLDLDDLERARVELAVVGALDARAARQTASGRRL